MESPRVEDEFSHLMLFGFWCQSFPRLCISSALEVSLKMKKYNKRSQSAESKIERRSNRKRELKIIFHHLLTTVSIVGFMTGEFCPRVSPAWRVAIGPNELK